MKQFLRVAMGSFHPYSPYLFTVPSCRSSPAAAVPAILHNAEQTNDLICTCKLTRQHDTQSENRKVLRLYLDFKGLNCWSINRSIDLSATNDIIKFSCSFRQVTFFSYLLEMWKTTTTSCCISKFIQFIISFPLYLIRCAGPSGSLTVRFYRESNHLSHSCDKPALERLKCQVVFITSTAGLRLNLSLVYATALLLLCWKMWNCLVYANANCLAH